MELHNKKWALPVIGRGVLPSELFSATPTWVGLPVKKRSIFGENPLRSLNHLNVVRAILLIAAYLRSSLSPCCDNFLRRYHRRYTNFNQMQIKPSNILIGYESRFVIIFTSGRREGLTSHPC